MTVSTIVTVAVGAGQLPAGVVTGLTGVGVAEAGAWMYGATVVLS